MARDKATSASASVGICVRPLDHLQPAGANAQAEAPRKRHLDCSAQRDSVMFDCSPVFRLAVSGSQNDSSFLVVEEALLRYK